MHVNKILEKKDYKKSPLKEKPLRQAGQSLDQEINRLFDEKIFFHSYWMFDETEISKYAKAFPQ
jgi:hypothetical protein